MMGSGRSSGSPGSRRSSGARTHSGLDDARGLTAPGQRYKVKSVNLKLHGIPHNPTGQAVVERSNRTLKEMLHRQAGQTPSERHWTMEKTVELNQPVYFKDVLTLLQDYIWCIP
ncbi:Ribonuclease H-like containing protein [Cricetulus griseus]|nr:Ribonuclease H-like containing protein [Cricetulus griseus]